MQTMYRIYPIIALTVLAGLTFWLERSTRAPDDLRRSGLSHAPDFMAENTSTRRFDKQGALRVEMAAAKVTHYPVEGRADMQTVSMRFTRPDQRVNVRAQTGTAWETEERVDLAGQVEVERERPNFPLSTLRTEAMQVWPRDEKMRSLSPVTLTQAQNQITATRMEADNLFGTATFTGNVHMQYQRKAEGRNKP